MTIMSVNSLNNINIVKPENKVVAKLPVENKINVTTNVTTIKDTSTISVKTNCPVPKVSIFELSKNKAFRY